MRIHAEPDPDPQPWAGKITNEVRYFHIITVLLIITHYTPTYYFENFAQLNLVVNVLAVLFIPRYCIATQKNKLLYCACVKI